MTATASLLEGWIGNGAALSFVIEGHTTVYATEALPGAFGSSPWAAWSDPTHGSLTVGGQLTQSIKLYTPDINPDTISINIVDTDQSLTSVLFRTVSSAGHTTFLTSSVVAGSTATINVSDTTGFAASGTIWIGAEAIAYTGKTATTFTGITRQSYGANQTNGGTTFSPSHLIGNNVSVNARTAPAVTDYPRTWYGRFCHLLLHVKDPLTGVFNTANDARKVVTGRIEKYSRGDDGSVTIEIKTAEDLLYKQIGPDQWHASLNEGMYINADNDTLVVVRSNGATTYGVAKSLGLNGTYTHDALADAVNARLLTNTWDARTGAVNIDAGDIWRLELVDTADGPRYRMRATDSGNFADADRCSFKMHPLALALLGFVDDPATVEQHATFDGTLVGTINLQNTITSGNIISYLEAIAIKPPIVYQSETPTYKSQIQEVTNEVNTFVTQTTADFAAWPASNGVVQIRGGKLDNRVFAVQYTSGTPSTLAFHAQQSPSSGLFMNNPDEPAQAIYVRLGEDGAEPPVVRQVFAYRGPAGTLLLQLLLSSGGSSGYNHATYDTITTAGFGAGVPASLVDVVSWEALNDIQVNIVVNEPQPFYKYLEPILAVSGRYVVWKSTSATTQPKLTIVKPSLDSAFYSSTWRLTESNKANSQRTKVDISADGLINRIVVKYGVTTDGSKDKAVTLTVDDIPSQSDYGRRRTITIDAGPVVNVPEIVSQTISPALTYFSRPVATAERSINASLMRMAPGDAAILTDLHVVDPTTGSAGATVYCWVLDTRFDLKTGTGTVRVVWLPEKTAAYTGLWAPSARVDETAGGGGYSGDVSKILTFRAHEYTDSAASGTDASYFVVGDKVRVTTIDLTPAVTWVDTIAAKGTNTATLTTGSGGLFDSTKLWVMEYDDYATVTTTQKNSAFWDVATPGYEWGHSPSFSLARTPTYSQGMARPDALFDVANEPVSVHHVNHLARGLNNYLAYRSRSVLVNETFNFAAPTVTGTTDELIFLMWTPIYGHVGTAGTRGLKCRVRGHQTGGGTATFTVTSSALAPSGSAFTGFTFPAGKSSAVITTTSATNAWSSETSLACSPTNSGPGGMYGTWISVYAKGSGGGIVATLDQIFVCEAGL